MSTGFHIAQANVAYARGAEDDPVMAEFMARIDEMNALAERTPGFVWRHLTDSRDPSQREFEDPLVLFNMSVWETIDDLHRYTYRSAHAEVYASRKQWFTGPQAVVGGHALALWWIPKGTLPTVAEAKERLELITRLGPTDRAFTFKQRFSPPESPR
jgi:heme-degrading monooxygenase HmoA